MLCENHYLISAFFPRLGNFRAQTREIFIPSKGTKTVTGAWMEKYLHQRWLKQGAPTSVTVVTDKKGVFKKLKYLSA